MRTFMNRVVNPIVRALLRSPLHGLLSRNVMLITVTGRRTGRSYTLPVQYARRADTVYVFSPGDRRWWRNLDQGGAVTVRIGDETLTGMGKVQRGATANGTRAALEGTSLAKSARRFPDGVVVRLGLEPTDRS